MSNPLDFLTLATALLILAKMYFRDRALLPGYATALASLCCSVAAGVSIFMGLA